MMLAVLPSVHCGWGGVSQAEGVPTHLPLVQTPLAMHVSPPLQEAPSSKL